MYSADNTVHHLLWCILVALRTADQEKTFTSEMARRRFIANWLDTARGNPSFRGMNAEFTTLRQLLETSDKGVPVDSTLSVLLSHASAVEQCDLFRFRSALNILMQKGWHKHALQLTCTENAFQPAGNMVQPITFQLLLNRTTENSEDAEMIFHTEGFQGVVANEMELDNRRIIRTLHIGTPSIPAGEWSPSKDNIWQPPKNSAPFKKESYH
ncbi:hypothetical protein [Yersinia ruckeri]|uniref:hypothetical protein n=1 Tax=Yersinia ruckeri TaxID=29486 RepID=UPI0034E0A0F1